MKKRAVGSIGVTMLLVLVFVIAGAYLAYSRVNNENTQLQDVEKTQLAKENIKSGAFTFTAAGDFSSNDEADAVLRGISAINPDFTLALGDLSYGGNGSEQAWCDFVKSRVGTDSPFELIAGNHDDRTKDGDIREYTKCLPNQMDNIVGDYGVEYYFDYEDTARFIMISPDIKNYGSDYTKGSERLKWIVDTVRDARKKGIEWIVLGMHKNCITPGVKTCEIGEDLLNTAVELKIDLVLQGHEHGYYRSKQLALNKDTCPAIVINEYNESCIVKEGGVLDKQKGTVIVISSAGGKGIRDVNFEDKEIGYFESVNGANVGNSFGFASFSVSKEEIKAEFISTSGDFTDSFTIK